MTKIEKNILVAMEDASGAIGTKVTIENAKEDNKSFFVKYTTKTLSLYWGRKRSLCLIAIPIWHSLPRFSWSISNSDILFNPETERD